MIIAVGSTNPVKFNAIKTVLSDIYPKAVFRSIKVDSKVKNQPISIKETKLGAKNRALAALKKLKADLAVGIEGGVFIIDNQMYNFAWVAIADRFAKLSFGGGMCFVLPPVISDKIKTGQELGPLIDKLVGKKDVKKKGGAIEVLTNGLTTRTAGYVELVKMAMVKFRRPELYT